jgi:predicted transcriptional regulator of viral defense system
MFPKFAIYGNLWKYMQYQVLKEQLKDFSVFSMSDIRKIDQKFYPSRLSQWQEKGYIKKLRRGYYVFADTSLNEEKLFLIANHLYSPSYVSLESALSYYGLIPEGVYSITSVGTKKTARFQTPVADFVYRNIRPQLLFGYHLKKIAGQGYKIAEIEKAVLDYLYLNPHIVREADFHEWRFNSEEFILHADIGKLREYAKSSYRKSFCVRLEKLISLIEKNK